MPQLRSLRRSNVQRYKNFPRRVQLPHSLNPTLSLRRYNPLCRHSPCRSRLRLKTTGSWTMLPETPIPAVNHIATSPFHQARRSTHKATRWTPPSPSKNMKTLKLLLAGFVTVAIFTALALTLPKGIFLTLCILLIVVEGIQEWKLRNDDRGMRH